MISKHIRISLTSKASYLMDIPHIFIKSPVKVMFASTPNFFSEFSHEKFSETKIFFAIVFFEKYFFWIEPNSAFSMLKVFGLLESE